MPSKVTSISCLGPLGRPFEPIDPPAEAWMVAGGVGLAPFATLGDALIDRGTKTTLFYGARSGCGALLSRLVRVSAASGSCWPPRTGASAIARALPCPRSASCDGCGSRSRRRRHDLRLRARADARGGGARRPSGSSARRRCRSSASMGCGMGGCYSCVIPVRDGHAAHHYVRSCIAGPVFRGDDVVWE